MYIVVEGHDMAGKSTFIKKLQKKFDFFCREVVLVTEPYMGHPTGQQIRDFLKNKHTNSDELYRLYRENREYLWNSVIRPAKEAGKIVISDRNFISSMVYQENMGMMNILGHNQVNVPDMVFLLSTSHETYCKRLKAKKNLEVIEIELGKREVFENHKRRYKEACSLLARITDVLVIPVKEM